MKDAIRDYTSMSAGFGTFCSECGEFATDDHYHCYICNSDDFDLCPTCYGQVIRCWDSQHHMVKRTVKAKEGVEAA